MSLKRAEVFFTVVNIWHVELAAAAVAAYTAQICRLRRTAKAL